LRRKISDVKYFWFTAD